MAIRWLDYENRAQSNLVKLHQSQSNLVNHLVKLQSWFQDHLIWSNLVDQWGLKWVLASGQCFKVFSVFMLYQFQVLKWQNKEVKTHMQIDWGHFIGFGLYFVGYFLFFFFFFFWEIKMIEISSIWKNEYKR